MFSWGIRPVDTGRLGRHAWAICELFNEREAVDVLALPSHCLALTKTIIFSHLKAISEKLL
jgi:hypothetical protein